MDSNSNLLPRLEAIEHDLKAMIPPNGKLEAFRAAAERESPERIAGVLFSIEEGARLLRNGLGIRLDPHGMVQVDEGSIG